MSKSPPEVETRQASWLSFLFRIDSETQDLLFRGHPYLGTVFTTRPITAFLTASATAGLFLYLPAHLIGVDHIRTAHGDFGICALGNWNWSLTDSFILPLMLLLGGQSFVSVRQSVQGLIHKTRVFALEKDEPAVDYPQYLATALEQRSGIVLCISLMLSVLIVGADTYDLWTGFITGHFPVNRLHDWVCAFTINEAGEPVRGFMFLNLAFDLVAYSFELAYVFLGVLFVLTYFSLLLEIAGVLGGKRPPFEFHPLVADFGERRLGLGPLATPFNWFLALAVMFSIGAFLHRLHQVDALNGEEGSWKYLKEIVRDAGKPLSTQDYAWAQLLHHNSWLPIAFVAFPAAVVCTLPLGTISMYVSAKRKQLIASNKLAYEAARGTGDELTRKRLDGELQELSQTNVWPNGDTVGQTCLVLILAAFVAAIAPPLVPWAIATGFLPSVWRFVRKPSR
jgi:hypothetical protein